jgi:hypothetical protein
MPVRNEGDKRVDTAVTFLIVEVTSASVTAEWDAAAWHRL